MKWKGWIGGVLLVMMLFGTLGCGKKRGPVTGGMVDGPGMMYTPEDQSPFAGKWQSRDGSIVMEVESSDPLESSRIQVFVDGKLDFESDMWVYQTGSVKLTQEHKRILMTGTFSGLTFNHKENAFRIRYSDDSGLKWLTRDDAACGEEDVSFSYEPQTLPPAAWSCPGILPGMWQPSQMRCADICTFRQEETIGENSKNRRNGDEKHEKADGAASGAGDGADAGGLRR